MGYLQALRAGISTSTMSNLCSRAPAISRCLGKRRCRSARRRMPGHIRRSMNCARPRKGGMHSQGRQALSLLPASGMVGGGRFRADRSRLPAGEPGLPLSRGLCRGTAAAGRRALGGLAMAASNWNCRVARISSRQREDALLVGELFDALEQEERLAAGLKPALRSLLPTVLQAALIDPAAFADPAHPLRSMLDKVLRLGRCLRSAQSSPGGAGAGRDRNPQCQLPGRCGMCSVSRHRRWTNCWRCSSVPTATVPSG